MRYSVSNIYEYSIFGHPLCVVQSILALLTYTKECLAKTHLKYYIETLYFKMISEWFKILFLFVTENAEKQYLF